MGEVDDLASHCGVQDVWVKVGAGGPDHSAQLRVDANLGEGRCVAKGFEDTLERHQRGDVDFTSRAVVETQVEAEATERTNLDYVFQHELLERFDLVEGLLFARKLPVSEELFAMERRPLGDQGQGLGRQVAGQQAWRIDGEKGLL
jgi:hypothetical protein